jgi:TMEM175 potassium channel family protein
VSEKAVKTFLQAIRHLAHRDVKGALLSAASASARCGGVVFDGEVATMSEPNEFVVQPEKETGRIEAFSDGVFAIAITLLILEIKVPNAHDLGPSGGLGAALLRLWPSYLAFVTSFATILVMWVNHHRLFNHIRRSDQAFLFWNGLLLFLVTFVPFPTALLAEYLTHAQARLAVSVYSGTFVAIALAFCGLWWHASAGRGLLARGVNQAEVERITRQYRFGPLLYLVAFVASFFSVWLSLAICLCLAVFFASGGLLTNRRTPPGRRTSPI